MAQEGDKEAFQVTDAMVAAAASVLEDSAWFDADSSIAVRLAAEMLQAASACRNS